MNQTILIIEDELDIRELLAFHARKNGYQPLEAESGERGLVLAREKKPDAILLDIMLPGMDGMDVCRKLKQDAGTKDIPIILVTARGEEADIVSGLEMGATDYVTKPFSPRVVMARLKAVLRRDNVIPGEDETVVYNDIEMDPGRHLCRIDGKLIDLTATEFKLLHLLIRHPGWVYTRQQIVDKVRGEDYAVTERAVDVQVVGLRKKLGDYSDLIETVRGVGYRARDKSLEYDD